MKQTICDVCKKEKTGCTLSLELLDDEHPHNGSQMTTTVDVCFDCLIRYNERVDVIPIQIELSEFNKIVIL